MSDKLIHANPELRVAPTTIGGLTLSAALKAIRTFAGSGGLASSGSARGPKAGQTGAAYVKTPAAGDGVTAADAAQGAAGGIAWKAHNDHTLATTAGITDGLYIGNNAADSSSGITGLTAKITRGRGSANSGRGDGFPQVPLGATGYGDLYTTPTGTTRTKQFTQFTAFTPAAGAATGVKLTFTTQSASPGVHGGTDTVAGVELFVFEVPAMVLSGSGEAYSGGSAHDVYDTPGVRVYTADPTKPAAIDWLVKAYTADVAIAASPAYASSATYTSATDVSGLKASTQYTMVAVPILQVGGDSSNKYVGVPEVGVAVSHA